MRPSRETSESMPKWNLSIPPDTDRLVRSHLAREGMKKGDLSALVNDAVRENVMRKMAAKLRSENPRASAKKLEQLLESAVRREIFGELVHEIQERNKDSDPDEIQREIDEAVAWVRAHRT